MKPSARSMVACALCCAAGASLITVDPGARVLASAARVFESAANGLMPAAGAFQARDVPDYITGVVQSSHGPEAGVWVIAETRDLPTNFIKIVVTDDRGRFVLPELPAANYRVWVRGYGLVDSTPVQMKPRTDAVPLTATIAKTPQDAARIYPGNYWLSL